MSAYRSLARPVLARSRVQTQRRTLIVLKEAKYTTSATSDSGGRNGHVTLNDAPKLEYDLEYPKELGGRGHGHNPEQFFAIGLTSCFINQGQLLASQQKKQLPKDAKTTAYVSLGQPEGKQGFGINVRIVNEGWNDEALVKATEEACAYSRALREGAQVTYESK